MHSTSHSTSCTALGNVDAAVRHRHTIVDALEGNCAWINVSGIQEWNQRDESNRQTREALERCLLCQNLWWNRIYDDYFEQKF